MRYTYSKVLYFFLTIILLSIISSPLIAQDRVIELNFAQLPDSAQDISRTLQSIVKVRDPGGPCQNGLYLLTHYGNREDLFEEENRSMIENPLKNRSWRYCSVYTAAANDTVIVGRNWDNENVGSIIINLYFPANGYSSVSFSRAVDLDFPLNMDLEEIIGTDLGKRLLLSPFYAMDGMNEHGLTVAVAGNRGTTQKPLLGKDPIYMPYLIRKILDQTKSVEEAVKLVDKYIPFDLDQNSLNSHLMVADASGRSVILEYESDQWRIIESDKSWQVMTTKTIFNVSDANLRDKCWRYKGISEALDKTKGAADWHTGMRILQDVSQIGTTWSVVYSPTSKDLYFSVYQHWDTIYHIRNPWDN